MDYRSSFEFSLKIFADFCRFPLTIKFHPLNDLELIIIHLKGQTKLKLANYHKCFHYILRDIRLILYYSFGKVFYRNLNIKPFLFLYSLLKYRYSNDLLYTFNKLEIRIAL